MKWAAAFLFVLWIGFVFAVWQMVLGDPVYGLFAVMMLPGLLAYSLLWILAAAYAIVAWDKGCGPRLSSDSDYLRGAFAEGNEAGTGAAT